MSDFGSVKWGEFRISDIFNVEGTITTHPTHLKPNGKTPRITCAATNNGLDDVYRNEPTESGGVLTIDSATIGYVSYQENDFIATDHVEKLSLKCQRLMNRHLGLFIKQCIDQSVCTKYGYGYKFSQGRIKRQIIKLPLDSKGKPNWAFMESYMKDREKRKLQIIISHFNAKLNLPSLRGGGIPDLATTRFHRGRPHENRTRAIELRGNPMGRVCSY